MKTTTVKDIRRLRQALDMEYRRFVKSFNDIGTKFKQAVKDSDITLAAMEKFIGNQN